jgi:hypothetical protein
MVLGEDERTMADRANEKVEGLLGKLHFFSLTHARGHGVGGSALFFAHSA